MVTGHHLGLYRALAAGPARAAELAERTSTNPRYVTEWLRGQAAGGYVEYDPVTDTYSMTEEQAFALANPDGGVYIPGAFVLALGTLKAEPRITEAFRTGAGMGWHEHHRDVFTGCEQFFRPGYTANLITPPKSRVTSTVRSTGIPSGGAGIGTERLPRGPPTRTADPSWRAASARPGSCGALARVTTSSFGMSRGGPPDPVLRRRSGSILRRAAADSGSRKDSAS